MKRQLLNIIVGLGLILGSTTFVRAMEEQGSNNNKKNNTEKGVPNILKTKKNEISESLRLDNLCNKIKEANRRAGKLVCSWGAKGIAAIELFSILVFITTLFHIIIQVVVSARICERIVTNKHVFALLGFLRIAKPLSEIVIKSETVMRNAKWFNWLQNDNSLLHYAFLVEVVACVSSPMIALLSHIEGKYAQKIINKIDLKE